MHRTDALPIPCDGQWRWVRASYVGIVPWRKHKRDEVSEAKTVRRWCRKVDGIGASAMCESTFAPKIKTIEVMTSRNGSKRNTRLTDRGTRTRQRRRTIKQGLKEITVFNLGCDNVFDPWEAKQGVTESLSSSRYWLTAVQTCVLNQGLPQPGSCSIEVQR